MLKLTNLHTYRKWK